MILGYARVSTEEQSLEVQLDVLQTADVERAFSEKVSGPRRARPEPDLAAGSQPAAELDWSGLAARLRSAEPGQGPQAEAHSSGRERERDDPAGFVDRLRGAFDRLDRDDCAEKMRSHRETREAEEQARDREVERIRADEAKREREREELTQREAVRLRSRDRGGRLER